MWHQTGVILFITEMPQSWATEMPAYALWIRKAQDNKLPEALLFGLILEAFVYVRGVCLRSLVCVCALHVKSVFVTVNSDELCVYLMNKPSLCSLPFTTVKVKKWPHISVVLGLHSIHHNGNVFLIWDPKSVLTQQAPDIYVTSVWRWTWRSILVENENRVDVNLKLT